MTSYSDIDLDKNPCFFLDCRHIITLECMDGQMETSKFYSMDDNVLIIGLVDDNLKPLALTVKGCPWCRGSIRNVIRYSRIVKRALLDESTKKFVTWSNARFVPLSAQLLEQEERLEKATDIFMSPLRGQPVFPKKSIMLDGIRQEQLNIINLVTGLDERLGPFLRLREGIARFAYAVQTQEQPYALVSRMAEESARKTGDAASFRYDSSILQSRAGILAGALLLRCDYDVLSELGNVHKNHKPRDERDHPWLRGELNYQLSANREDCRRLINDAESKSQPMVIVQARLLLAKFAALERMAPTTSTITQDLLDTANEQLEQASAQVSTNARLAHLQKEIEAVQKMLREETFYTPVTTAEMQAVYNAMATELRGTGHWYHCVNMHPVSFPFYFPILKDSSWLTACSSRSESVEPRWSARRAPNAALVLAARTTSVLVEWSRRYRLSAKWLAWRYDNMRDEVW